MAYVMGVPTGGVEGGPSDECEFVSQLIAIKIMGPDSIGKTWLEKLFEFRLEIPHTEKL